MARELIDANALAGALAPLQGFEVELVFDGGASMVFWRQFVAEVQALFERPGAFRAVRAWWLSTDDPQRAQVYSGVAVGLSPRVASDQEALVDRARSRRLILVVTDCVSPAWYSGRAQAVLERWGEAHLVTLLPVLSRRLWPRTALCAAADFRVSAAEPGSANARLQARDILRLADEELSAPLPVIAMERGSLELWAKLALGTEGSWVRGMAFSRDVPAVFEETAGMVAQAEGASAPRSSCASSTRPPHRRPASWRVCSPPCR